MYTGGFLLLRSETKKLKQKFFLKPPSLEVMLDLLGEYRNIEFPMHLKEYTNYIEKVGLCRFGLSWEAVSAGKINKHLGDYFVKRVKTSNESI